MVIARVARRRNRARVHYFELFGGNGNTERIA